MRNGPVDLPEGTYQLGLPFPPGLLPSESMTQTLCYAIRQRAGWLMVDAGLNDDQAFNALCQQMQQLGLSFGDLRWLVITHSHPDHCGLAERIKKASKAKMIMHQQEWMTIQFMRRWRDGSAWEDFHQWSTGVGMPLQAAEQFRDRISNGLFLYPLDVEPDILIDGPGVPVGDTGTLRLIHTPGHSPGHLCVYDGKNKLFFSGDHVLKGISSHVSASHLSGENRLAMYMASLKAVRTLDVDLVLPAHEETFRGLRERVDELLQHHEQRLVQVLAVLGSGPVDPWEVASRVDWVGGRWKEMDALNRMMAMQETLAHLQLLEQRGLARPSGDGQWRVA